MFPIVYSSIATILSIRHKPLHVSVPSCFSTSILHQFLQVSTSFAHLVSLHIYPAFWCSWTCTHIASYSTLLTLFSAHSHLFIKSHVRIYTYISRKLLRKYNLHIYKKNYKYWEHSLINHPALRHKSTWSSPSLSRWENRNVSACQNPSGASSLCLPTQR